MNLTFKEVLGFRRMLAPVLIKFIFWLGIAACWIVGIMDLFQPDKLYTGIFLLTVGTIIVRIFSEILIVFFQINNTLLDILRNLKKQSQPQSNRP